MTTPTPRLGLKIFTTADQFKVQDWDDNANVLDGAPGLLLCTSTTHPTTWTAAQNGMLILETDTGLVWRYTSGTTFVRQYASGKLGLTKVTAAVNTSATTLQTAVSVAVTVPAGNRSIEVRASGPGVYSTVDLTRLAIFRDGTQLQSWLSHGTLTGTASAQPRPVSMTVIDDSVTAGAHTYTLQYAAEPGYGGTSTLQAAATTPLMLSVVEI